MDATRNSLNMLAQNYYSHQALMHKNSAAKHEMLHQKGVNWNDLEDAYKRGSYYQRKTTRRAFTAEELDRIPEKHRARINPDEMIERKDVVRLNMPPLVTVVNRVDVLFDGAEPICGELPLETTNA
jgi:tRNA(His) 5'-end guanylyltransferase